MCVFLKTQLPRSEAFLETFLNGVWEFLCIWNLSSWLCELSLHWHAQVGGVLCGIQAGALVDDYDEEEEDRRRIASTIKSVQSEWPSCLGRHDRSCKGPPWTVKWPGASGQW